MAIFDNVLVPWDRVFLYGNVTLANTMFARTRMQCHTGHQTAVRGLGLLGMEERVGRLGGALRIDSEPGRGTTVAAELPLPEIARQEMDAAHSRIAG